MRGIGARPLGRFGVRLQRPVRTYHFRPMLNRANAALRTRGVEVSGGARISKARPVFKASLSRFSISEMARCVIFMLIHWRLSFFAV